ncbi:MAG: hypothetical protein ACYC5N_11465 [Endomicrobiales bacterium]
MSKLILILVFLLAGLASAARAEVQIVPLLTGQLSLGRSSIGSDEPTGGNAVFDLSPVVRFNERTSLLPRIGVNYNGLMTETQITDYGTLYQQYVDSVASMKLIHELSPGSLKVRAEGGYKKELARETRDEEWSKGLYDFDNTFASVGLEKRTGRGSVGIGYRYSSFVFPNYTTLASQEGQSFMGVHTFDNTVSRLFFTSRFSFSRSPRGKMVLDLGANLDAVNYPDQKVVDASGAYLADKRRDTVTSVTPAVAVYSFREKRDSSLGLAFGYTAKSSNQNYLDVDTPWFTPRYFDYREFTVQPYVTVKFHPADWRLYLGYALGRKDYTDRLAQDGNGAYTGEKASVNTGTLNLGVAYPLGERLELNFTLSSSANSSNYKYEKFYRYNFTAANVLLGLSYEL